MPDIIWAWDSHEGHQYSLRESAWGRHQYLRATPELLALIEAAKTCRDGNAGWWNRANKVMAAALAFAKSQDQ